MANAAVREDIAEFPSVYICAAEGSDMRLLSVYSAILLSLSLFLSLSLSVCRAIIKKPYNTRIL